MRAESSSPPDLVVLSAIGIVTCCAFPILVAVAAALAVGPALRSWVLVLAAGAVGAVLLARWLGCRHRCGRRPVPRPARPQTTREE